MKFVRSAALFAVITTVLALVSPTPARADDCLLTFARGSGVDLLGLTFEVDFAGSGAMPAGEILLDCQSPGPGYLVSGLVLEPSVLTVQIVGLEEPITQGDVAVCRFTVGTGESVTAGDFGVMSTLAGDTNGMNVTLPGVTISNIACGGAVTTTTTTTLSTTTTSFPFGSTTSTTMPPASCLITVDYDDNVTVAGVQVKVDYTAVAGRFALIPSTLTPQCEALGGTEFKDFGFNDNTALDELTISYGAPSPPGLVAPQPFVRCAFLPDSTTVAPTVDDFIANTTMAFASGGSPISPLPDFIVSDVTCTGFGGTTTTTTLPGGGEMICGDPVDPGALVVVPARPEVVTASDALFALNAAVGLLSCELCVCDVDDSGVITAGDALRILTAAVGGAVTLDCPACDP